MSDPETPSSDSGSRDHVNLLLLDASDPDRDELHGVLSTVTTEAGAIHQASTPEGAWEVAEKLEEENALPGEQRRRNERAKRLSKTTYTSLVKAAPDAYIAFAEKGASNAHLPKRKIFHQAILGGCYVGFGALISLAIAGNLGGISGANPGVAKMAFAALFPVNLLLIVSTQGQLFTGNSAMVAAAKFEGFVSWKDLIRSWTISLGGNIVGCALFAAAAMAGSSVLVVADPYSLPVDEFLQAFEREAPGVPVVALPVGALLLAAEVVEVATVPESCTWTLAWSSAVMRLSMAVVARQ